MCRWRLPRREGSALARRLRPLARGAGVGVGVGVGVGIGALHSPAFALLFPAAFLAGSCFVARQSFALVIQQRRRAVFDLLERLSEKVTDEDESSDAD